MRYTDKVKYYNYVGSEGDGNTRWAVDEIFEHNRLSFDVPTLSFSSRIKLLYLFLSHTNISEAQKFAVEVDFKSLEEEINKPSFIDFNSNCSLGDYTICQFRGQRYELKKSFFKGQYWKYVGKAEGTEPQMFPAPTMKTKEDK